MNNKAKKEQQKTPPMPGMKSFAISFAAGYTSGIAGELFATWQNGQFNSKGLTKPSFKDNCIISGSQQVAKDFVKAALKKNPKMLTLSKSNPFLFGAATGIPMWALTRIVATPLQNRHNSKAKPYDGFMKSILNDAAYHTIKNGLDEYCAAKIFPCILPKVDSMIVRKLVEGSIAGVIGGGSYVLAFPFKSILTGQNISEAYSQFINNTPKVAIKKIAYTTVHPKYVQLLH
ncbi:hypothetical protein GPJ56_007294 [Histomonas meleagridis]|uniref:uncharacterized protein n=1 Tax=Histomonas meleagridis TaxID=135588 RepID=UPI00355983F5|nr:hypothetical protein GPJ56_007294 [Histomonas meleagridis]KAH0804140.1 hypothetical protein GO595_002970 [Histomonas meleagridis]